MRSRALAAAIKRVRAESRLSGRVLSGKLGLSHGTISHWETGRRVPSPEDVASLLTAAGVVGERKEEVLALARRAAEPNWLTVGMPGLPQQLAGVVECERAATDVVVWSLTVMPGLLQTSDYSRALAHASGMPEPDVEQRVMVRAGRREVLMRRSDPLRLRALVHENALREPAAPPEVLAEQLTFLAEMGERDNVELRVVPARVGWHPGLMGPFVLYEFPDASPVLHFEHFSSGAFVPEPDDVRAYREALDILDGIALSPADSAAFALRIAEEWEHTRWPTGTGASPATAGPTETASS